MDEFSMKLNNLLVETYRNVSRLEEMVIKKASKINLSISEIHVIDSISKGEKNLKTISDIATDLQITLPSVTIAVNKLVNKGYLIKHKSRQDARIVYVGLTKGGKKIELAHRYFHKRLTMALVSQLTSEEKRVMLSGINKLVEFFNSKILED
ncbi:MAG: MarR family transcriptional regulator [Oscillospiraceae bacterium]